MTQKIAAVAAALLAATLPLSLPPAAHGAAPRAHFYTYVRDWAGHTRSLVIRGDHTATESIDSGCCMQVVTVQLEVGHVRGSARHGSVRAEVTGVSDLDTSFFDAEHPAPAVGDVARLRLRDGVLHEPLTRATYCTFAAGRRNACGA